MILGTNSWSVTTISWSVTTNSWSVTTNSWFVQKALTVQGNVLNTAYQPPQPIHNYVREDSKKKKEKKLEFSKFVQRHFFPKSAPMMAQGVNREMEISSFFFLLSPP